MIPLRENCQGALLSILPILGVGAKTSAITRAAIMLSSGSRSTCAGDLLDLYFLILMHIQYDVYIFALRIQKRLCGTEGKARAQTSSPDRSIYMKYKIPGID